MTTRCLSEREYELVCQLARYDGHRSTVQIPVVTLRRLVHELERARATIRPRPDSKPGRPRR